MIWNFQDQQRLRPIDENNEHLFEQIQKEVESHDLVKLMGFEMYAELKRNINDYTVLISGGAYTYNDLEYTFNGLEYVCAFLFYARYIRQSQVKDTFTGFVTHTADGMQPLSNNEILNLENRYKEIAATEWESCLHYLKSIEPETELNAPPQNINWWV